MLNGNGQYKRVTTALFVGIMATCAIIIWYLASWSIIDFICLILAVLVGATLATYVAKLEQERGPYHIAEFVWEVMVIFLFGEICIIAIFIVGEWLSR